MTGNQFPPGWFIADAMQTLPPPGPDVGLQTVEINAKSSQIGIVAAKLSEYESALADQRMRAGKVALNPGTTWCQGARDQAGRRVDKILGEKFGIGEQTVYRAIKVLERGTPELVRKVEEGEITVTEALRISSLKPDSQRQITAMQSKPGRIKELQKRTFDTV